MDADVYGQFNNLTTALDEENKQINLKLDKFRQAVNNREDAANLENEIQKAIDRFKDVHAKLENAYNNRNAPPIPQGELDRRQKKVQDIGNSLNSLKNTFKELSDKKYGYRLNEKFQGEYKQTEEMKNMSNAELLAYQKEKIKQQDNQIDDITLEVKKGRVLAKEAKHQMEDQDKQLDALQDDVNKLDSKMNRVTKKFENYVAKQSTCTIIITLVIELAIALVIYLVLSG